MLRGGLFTNIAVAVVSSACDAFSFSTRRVMLLDTNQQRIVGLSEEGIFASQQDVGHKYRVFWPHQIECFEQTPSGSKSDILPSAEVYVSEYLGEIP